MTDQLANKSALVTAATKGIGLACARILAEHGAKVYIAARNEQEGKECVAEMTQQGLRAAFIPFDAHKKEDYPRLIETVVGEEGRLDILVNNYGSTDVAKDKDLLNGDTEAFFSILQTNVQSVYLACKPAVRHMIGKGGAIVNISSIAAVVPDLSRLAYSVSKAAIDALTKNIALQYARFNVRCNAVLPGFTATDAALQNMSEEFKESFLKHVPLGRAGRPEDVAAAVLYYASDASSYVTGMIHEVAGGYALGTPQYADFSGVSESSR